MTYKPGFYAATVDGALRHGLIDSSEDEFSFVHEDGTYEAAPVDEVDDVRPLVVLDLDKVAGMFEDPAAYIVRTLRDGDIKAMGTRENIADQIEAQTKPPKPAEPKGLGAVVEASNGMRWVAARPSGEQVRWRSWPAGMWHPYEDIDAVRVLSEGVQA